MQTKYSHAIRMAFEYMLDSDPDFFIIGQGLWSPWYVGETMTDLDKKFGRSRIIDCPVSELATTGAVVGAATVGVKSIVIHPRVDFMLLAVDQIVTQAAKWNHMFGGQSSAGATFRGIINRGGEQGAQHSQSLQSWFAHIPGLRVVMPYSPSDARNLLVAAIKSNDPVLFLDDRWLYELEEEIHVENDLNLINCEPIVRIEGSDLTVIGAGHAVHTLMEAAKNLKSNHNIDIEVVDLRIINPLKFDVILNSVAKTGALYVLDEDWGPCGLSSEIISVVMENLSLDELKKSPKRRTFPFAPAPTSKVLESIYYPNVNDVISDVISIVKN